MFSICPRARLIAYVKPLFYKNKEILAFFIKLLKSLDSLIFTLVIRSFENWRKA